MKKDTCDRWWMTVQEFDQNDSTRPISSCGLATVLSFVHIYCNAANGKKQSHLSVPLIQRALAFGVKYTRMQLLEVALAYRNRKTGGKPLTNYSLKILCKYTMSDSTILMWYHQGRLWSKAREGGTGWSMPFRWNPYNEVCSRHHRPHLLGSGGSPCPTALAIQASSLSLPVAPEGAMSYRLRRDSISSLKLAA